MDGTHTAPMSLWLPAIDIPAFHVVISATAKSVAVKRLVQRVGTAQQVRRCLASMRSRTHLTIHRFRIMWMEVIFHSACGMIVIMPKLQMR
jgi:hypothetical protein